MGTHVSGARECFIALPEQFAANQLASLYARTAVAEIQVRLEGLRTGFYFDD